jgi:predicted glutamine amidotransferase
MFSIISSKNVNEKAFHYLIESSKSLLKQSDYNKENRQKDGWGISYFENKKTKIYKSSNPIYKENSKIDLSRIKSNILLAHIRKASNPKVLPFEELIGVKHSQPFANDQFTYTHNGTLYIVDEIKENLGKYKKNIKGLNDSEVLFWELIKLIDSYGDIYTAFKMMIDEINTIWVSVKDEYKKKGISQPFKGLNIILSDYKNIYSLCLYNLDKKLNSIMTKNWPWQNMALKIENDYAVLASEPLDDGNWENIAENNFIHLYVENHKIKYSFKKLL